MESRACLPREHTRRAWRKQASARMFERAARIEPERLKPPQRQRKALQTAQGFTCKRR
jgi:hypothetical protein